MGIRKFRKGKHEYTLMGGTVKEVKKTAENPVKWTQVEIDQTGPDGKPLEAQYANISIVVHSPEEFTLDFISQTAINTKPKLSARIILSPLQAKRFLKALSDSVEAFDKSAAK
jgi:hypothetical protein